MHDGPWQFEMYRTVQHERCHGSATHGTAQSTNLEGGTKAAQSLVTGAPASGGLGKTLLLGSFFGGWYLFNIYFNL